MKHSLLNTFMYIFMFLFILLLAVGIQEDFLVTFNTNFLQFVFLGVFATVGSILLYLMSLVSQENAKLE